jgi:hypothetical protein
MVNGVFPGRFMYLRFFIRTGGESVTVVCYIYFAFVDVRSTLLFGFIRPFFDKDGMAAG